MVPSADGGPMVPSADGDGGPAIWKYSVPVAIPHYSRRSAQFPSSFPSQHIIPVEVLGSRRSIYCDGNEVMRRE